MSRMPCRGRCRWNGMKRRKQHNQHLLHACIHAHSHSWTMIGEQEGSAPARDGRPKKERRPVIAELRADAHTCHTCTSQTRKKRQLHCSPSLSFRPCLAAVDGGQMDVICRKFVALCCILHVHSITHAAAHASFWNARPCLLACFWRLMAMVLAHRSLLQQYSELPSRAT